MDNGLVINVIFMSVISGAITSAILFWLLHRNQEQRSKKRVDDIMKKIQTQSNIFNEYMNELRKDLKDYQRYIKNNTLLK